MILLVPAAAALAVTAAVHPLFPTPRTGMERLGWWAGLLSVGLLVATVVERVGRRLLPLVMLLKLSMLFPDRAPSRFAVAREAGSVRKLRARLAKADGDPSAGEEAWTAEQILALAVALQSHDRQTRGHSERVRTFTDLLAEQMKITQGERDRLRWAALLHDIGKLTVASGILNKPGKLDEHEWDVMRRHPAEGARIAAPLLAWMGPWAGAIAQHHERFDGAGYPAKIAGQDISLAGRIVAVADSYDTMTAARSYKKPMAIRAAREELARCAGSQFDPTVVRAFLSISLPLLLWKTGPLSFLVQLPFLSRMQQLAQQGAAIASQGVAAATVAAGVTAMTVAGPAPATASPLPQPVAIVTLAPSAAPSAGSTAGAGRPSAGPTVPKGPGPGGSPAPSPKPSPTPSPSPTGGPSGGPLPPLPTNSPLPLPLPTDSPLPLPLPSVSPPPLPLPSVSPPLPLPSPSLPLGSAPDRTRPNTDPDGSSPSAS